MKSNNSWLDYATLSGLVIGCIIPVLTYTLDKNNTIFKPDQVSKSLLLILLIIVITTVSNIILFKILHYNGTLNAVLANLTDTTNSLHLTLDTAKEIKRGLLDKLSTSIIDYEELKIIEESVLTGQDIIILTSELALESSDNFNDIIISNIKRGVKYTYVIPDVLRIEKKFKQLTQSWQTKAGLSKQQLHDLVKCYLLPIHQVYMTVAIYNSTSSALEVIVKFPTSNEYSQIQYPFVYKLAQEPVKAKETFVDNINKLISESKELK